VVISDEGAVTGPEERRRERLLDAALATFTRFGFRKTSMQEVAKAAELSRQGLYLHFANKEELFCATVRHALERGLADAGAQLADAKLALPARLCAGFDAWVGRYVGIAGGDVADLAEAMSRLVGPVLAEYESVFVERVEAAIRACGQMTAYERQGISARQVAETLNATARGLKHSCATRAEFGERLSVAVRALCLPLAERQ
jgi:AcrR family transcriptional regulator